MIPARRRSKNKPIDRTNPECRLISTRPATAPEQMPMTFGYTLPIKIHSRVIQVKSRRLSSRCADHHGHAGLQARGYRGILR